MRPGEWKGKADLHACNDVLNGMDLLLTRAADLLGYLAGAIARSEDVPDSKLAQARLLEGRLRTKHVQVTSYMLRAGG